MASSLHRRGLVTGLSCAVACAAPRAWSATSAQPYLDYEKRLREGLARGGVLTDLSDALLAETNGLRSQATVAGLAHDAAIAACAAAHVSDMIGRSYFAHQSPEGFGRNDRTGLLLRQIAGSSGENIASITRVAGGPPPTAREVLAIWLDSPVHRQNLFSPAWSHAGFSAMRAGTRFLACAVFVTVSQRLGKPLPLRAPNPGEALAGAQPTSAAYQLSAPGGRPESGPYSSGGAAPTLAPGAWRLRPLVGGSRAEALLGPIFVV
jgi:uncharacterized protein YkwD